MNPDETDPEALQGALVAARDAGVCIELAAMSVLSFDGADARSFLQGQLSNDVDALTADACQITSYNSPKGRMLANMVLWLAERDRYLALLPSATAESVRKRLSMYVLRSKVAIRNATGDLATFGVGGPRGEGAIVAVFGQAPEPLGVVRTAAATILGLPSRRFVAIGSSGQAAAWRDALLERVSAAPFSVWQWLTIRAGVPVITPATSDHFVAQTANLDALGGIDFRKGCYTGQEIIARMQYLGRLKERLYAFHGDDPNVVEGARLFSGTFGDQACGTVVNAAAAPGGGSDLLAVVQIAAADSGDVRLRAPDGPRLEALELPYAVPGPARPMGARPPRG